MIRNGTPDGLYKAYFLVLMPLFFVLHSFVRYHEALYWAIALKLFFVHAVATVLIAVAGRVVFSSFQKAAIFSFACMLFYFLFGSGHDALKQIFQNAFITRYVFVLPFSIMLFVALFFYLKKSKLRFHKLYSYLNVLFLLLIIIEIIGFGIKKAAQQEKLLKELTPCTNCAAPDIYLLIVDGYGGQKQLEQTFNFNNQPFYDSLQQKGFYIIDSSISNYSATNRAMASMLNMRYLGAEPDDFHAEFNKNSFTQYLIRQQYQIKNYSFFKIAGQYPPQPIEYFPVGPALLLNHTFLGRLAPVYHNLAGALQIKSERSRIKKIQQAVATQNSTRDLVTLQQLLTEIKIKKSSPPLFVYCHFVMPHPPYVFDKNGNPADTAASLKSRYIGYVEYTNKRLLSAVTQILANSAKPPVIMLLSDHGYRFDTAALLPDRFLNLAALCLPGKNYQPYYKGLSSVNLLRVFLNDQFGQRLPLLTDSTVY